LAIHPLPPPSRQLLKVDLKKEQDKLEMKREEMNLLDARFDEKNYEVGSHRSNQMSCRRG
jgi:hypothetical protein